MRKEFTKESYLALKEREYKEWSRNETKRFIKQQREKTLSPEIKTFDDEVNNTMGGYSPERIREIASSYIPNEVLSDADVAKLQKIRKDSMYSSFEAQKKIMDKAEKVIVKYQSLIDEAQKVVDKVDLSNIEDGFPCGDAFVYIELDHEIGRALRTLNGGNGKNHWVEKIFAAQFPVKYQGKGQCIDFIRKQCNALESFLRDNGIPAKTYSWID